LCRAKREAAAQQTGEPYIRSGLATTQAQLPEAPNYELATGTVYYSGDPSAVTADGTFAAARRFSAASSGVYSVVRSQDGIEAT